MNISATAIAMSALLPALMAACLIWASRRSLSFFASSWVFMFGGFLSLALALGLSRVLTPLELSISGDPESIRAGLVSAFLTAAFPEQSVRLLVTLCAIALWRKAPGQEVVMVCGLTGLGFALFENIMYSFTMPTMMGVGIGRVIPTVSHGASGLIMGSLLVKAFSHGTQFRVRPALFALGVPMLLHGLYDFGAIMIEVTEFPDLPDEPTLSDLKSLGPILAIMTLVTLVWLFELVWGALIVLGLRKRRGTPEPTQ